MLSRLAAFGDQPTRMNWIVYASLFGRRASRQKKIPLGEVCSSTNPGPVRHDRKIQRAVCCTKPAIQPPAHHSRKGIEQRQWEAKLSLYLHHLWRITPSLHLMVHLSESVETQSGGPTRNRTGVRGFAIRCVTTPPSGRREGANCFALPRKSTQSCAPRKLWLHIGRIHPIVAQKTQSVQIRRNPSWRKGQAKLEATKSPP